MKRASTNRATQQSRGRRRRGVPGPGQFSLFTEGDSQTPRQPQAELLVKPPERKPKPKPTTVPVDCSGFLSVDDVVKITPFVSKTIYRSIDAGELKAIKRGGRLLIEPSAVVEWIEGPGTAGGRIASESIRYLSLAEAASFTTLSERAIQRAIASGELVAFKCRSKWAIKPSDVKAWVTRGARTTPPTRRQKASPKDVSVSAARSLTTRPDLSNVSAKPALAPASVLPLIYPYADGRTQLRRGTLKA